MQRHIWILRGLTLITIGCALSATRVLPADTGAATEDARSTPDSSLTPDSVVDAGSNDDAPRLCPDGFALDPSDSCVAWHSPPEDWPTFYEHTATRLLDGRVLVVGRVRWNDVDISGAIFDPHNARWARLTGAPAPLVGRSATLLLDGGVLLVGGSEEHDHGYDQVVATTIVFDPQSETFTSTQAPSVARAYHSAAMLSDGRVLVAGGFTTSIRIPATTTSSVEIFDPARGTWSTVTPMLFARARHTGTVIRDQLLVVGGAGVSGQTTEIFSLENGWRGGPRLFGSSAAVLHTTTDLDGSALLVVADDGAQRMRLRSIYAGGEWLEAGVMSEPRSQHTATRLLDGRVLVAGGGPWYVQHSAEIYNPTSNIWRQTLLPPPGVWGGTATLLIDGRVLLLCSEGALLFEIAAPL